MKPVIFQPPRDGQSSAEWLEEVDPWLANGADIESDLEDIWEAHRLGMLLGRLHVLYSMHELLQRDPEHSAASLLAAMRRIEGAMLDRRREVAYQRIGRRLVDEGDAAREGLDNPGAPPCA